MEWLVLVDSTAELSVLGLSFEALPWDRDVLRCAHLTATAITAVGFNMKHLRFNFVILVIIKCIPRRLRRSNKCSGLDKTISRVADRV